MKRSLEMPVAENAHHRWMYGWTDVWIGPNLQDPCRLCRGSKKLKLDNNNIYASDVIVSWAISAKKCPTKLLWL